LLLLRVLLRHAGAVARPVTVCSPPIRTGRMPHCMTGMKSMSFLAGF